MTPTPIFILLVAVFWTFPATAAVLTYRMHGSSMENAKEAFKVSIKDASRTLSLRPQPQPEA